MAANVVKMVMGRNFTLRTTLGHSIRFRKDEPVNVPVIIAETAAQYGAVRVDGQEVFAEPVAKPAQPVDPAKRMKDIRAAIEAIVEKNNVDDFTAGGTPKVSAVSRETSYKVDHREVTTAWADRNEELLNNET